MKKLFSLLLVVAMIAVTLSGLTVFAEAVSVTVVSDDNSWANATWDAETSILTNVDGGYAFKATISKGNATLAAASADLVTAESVTIPSSFTVDGTTYPVTNVGGYALSGGTNTANANVKTVVISEGVVKLNDNALRNVTGLVTINFPASLTSIGSYALASTGITSLTIPATVTSLSKGCFSSTSSLVDFTLAEGSPIVTLPEEMLLKSAVVSVNFPRTITTISKSCFNQAKKLTTINGRSDVIDLSFVTEAVGQGGFYQCEGFTGEFILNAKTIGKECFKQTGSITKFTWGENVQSIISGLSFRYDNKIKEMVFLGKTAPSIDSNCFGNTSAFTIYYPAVSTGYDAAGYLAKTRVAIGGHISAMADDGADTTVTYTVVELTQSAEKTAVVAIYDDGEVMIGAKVVPVNAEGVNDAQTATFTGVTGAATAKIYTWNNLSAAKPLYEAFEFVPVAEEVPAE